MRTEGDGSEHEVSDRAIVDGEGEPRGRIADPVRDHDRGSEVTLEGNGSRRLVWRIVRRPRWVRYNGRASRKSVYIWIAARRSSRKEERWVSPSEPSS